MSTVATAAELAPLLQVLPQSYPEPLVDVSIALYRQLREELPDTPELRAADVAFALTERLSRDLGGQTFYMHKGYHWRHSERDEEIYRKFSGHNYGRLAMEYGLSEPRVRDIIAAVHRSRQGVLEM